MTLGIRPPETDLLFPLPGEGEQWDDHTVHTHYFGFSIPEAAIGAFIYVRWQPVYRLCSGGVNIFQGLNNLTPLDCAHTDFRVTMPWPDVGDGIIQTANGLRIEFVELGRVARLQYWSQDGSCSFDVLQTAVTPLLARGHVMPGEDTDSDPGAEPGGSEQFMHAVGELVLRGERHRIDCFAVRDRSWRQVRTEEEVAYPPVGWSPMYFGDDLVLNQVGVEDPSSAPLWVGRIPFPPDRPSHHFAWSLVNGEQRAVLSLRRTVLERHPRLHVPTRQQLELADEAGQVHALTGRALAVAQLPSWPNLLFFDSVYEWTDARGRIAHCTYQEVWHHAFQQLVKRRFVGAGDPVTEAPPRGQRRRGRPLVSDGPAARERILQSARQLFSEVGYEKTSLTEIAERAGLTRPAINYYFRSKESLYTALLDSTRDSVVGPGIKEAAAAKAMSSRLAAFLQAAVQVDSRDRSYARFIAASLLDAFRHPELRDRAQSQLDDVREFVERSLRAAIEEGEIRADTDVAAVTEMLVGMMWGMGLYAGFVGTHDQLEAVVAQFERLLEGDLW